MDDGSLATRQTYELFETEFGVCAIAWSSGGLTRLQLPEASAEATRKRIVRDRQADPATTIPGAVEEAISLLRAYFRGERIDFSAVRCDLGAVSPFHAALYAALRQVAWGETITYGALGQKIGAEGGARAIGQAMGRNPVPVIIPCHRVLASGGAIGGFSAPGGRTTKRRLLALESAGGAGLPLFDQA